MVDPESRDLSQLNGCGGKTEEKLNTEGYHNLMSVARADPQNLADRTDIGQGRCEKMVGHARELISGGSEFQTGTEIKEEQDQIKKISTGSDAFDDMLYGGVPTNYITEFYGEFGRGKTQLMHQLAVNVQLPEEDGGLNKECLYLDTENTFMADRFMQIAEAEGLDPDEALENVHVAQVFDSGHQANLTQKAHEVCADEDIGLLVVDSLMGHFRADYDGRSELSARQNAVSRHLKELRTLADSFNVAVAVTNQVLADPGQQFGDPTKPSGGNVVAHNCAFIIYLKGKKNHYAQLVDSPNLPQSECEFDITDSGIVDT